LLVTDLFHPIDGFSVQGFLKGDVAPAHQIVAVNNQEDEVDEFLRGTVDVAIKILS
jgi:hypothetical protein